MLMLLNVGKETLLNALIVRVVARITLPKLLSALVRKLGSDPLHSVGVELLRQLQQGDSVGRNSRRSPGIGRRVWFDLLMLSMVPSQ